MYDCLPSINLHPQYSFTNQNIGFTNCFKLPKYVRCSIPDSKWSSIRLNSTRFRDAIPFPSDDHEYEDLDIGLLEKGKNRELRLEREQKGKKDGPELAEPAAKSGNEEATDDLSLAEILKFVGDKEGSELVKEDDIVKPQELDSNLEELDGNHNNSTINVVKKMRQMVRRSNVIAKQVISIRSAFSLGFVSQFWVDTTLWVVAVVEVKPNLLSGDSGKLLLKEIRQVGDVILVENEDVLRDDLKLLGLETLVGYTVVTPRRQSIGKVRGYTFNINSGTVAFLELDSFGISIIPSSLVSTYALFVDDVLEVFRDTVVVRDAAVKRIQRLTKGFWGSQNAENSNNEFEEQSGMDGREDYPDYSEKRRKSRKFRSKKRRSVDDWNLPMDYL